MSMLMDKTKSYFPPGTVIVNFDHKKKIATNIIYDRDNGRSYREMAKLDSDGMVLEYKFKWLGKNK